jgi:hypothetical protein
MLGGTYHLRLRLAHGFGPEDGGTMLFRTIGKCLPGYTTSHPIRWYSSAIEIFFYPLHQSKLVCHGNRTSTSCRKRKQNYKKCSEGISFETQRRAVLTQVFLFCFCLSREILVQELNIFNSFFVIPLKTVSVATSYRLGSREVMVRFLSGARYFYLLGSIVISF